MVYSEKVRLAMEIAVKAHHGQVDKAGYPYIHHPIHLAEQMDTETETIVALLHDVVEDTDYRFEDLLQEGIPEEAVEELKLLCHEKGIPYLDYVRNMRGHLTALKVKHADLLHNMTKSRMPAGTDMSYFDRKYQPALQIVEQYLQELQNS